MHSRPTFLFDAQCPFCCQWVERWKKLTDDRVDYQPLSKPASSSQFVEADGTIYNGAKSVIRLMSYMPGRAGFFWAYRFVPGFAMTSEFFYKRVSSCRPCAEKLTRWLFSFRRG